MMSMSVFVVLLGFPTLAVGQGDVIKKRNFEEGPHFIQEPNSRVDFTNKTGVQIRCVANGKPPPQIVWALEDGTAAKDLTGLRLALPDGSLVFPPFRHEEYRQDVHAALYRCSATNTVGTIISRDVRVKAVITHIYDIQVHDAFVIRGNNTGILKCHIPSFLTDYVRVTGWIRDNAFRIDTNSLDGKYLMVPSNGDLFVRQVGHHDAASTFRCQTHHRLSKETRLSTSAGRLFVTDPQGNVPPRILDPLATLQVKAGENVILPCPAQGYPQPTLIWYIKDVTGHLIPVPSSGRHSFHREVLAIRDAQAADSAMYVCVASNIIGAAKAETALTVIGSLHAHIQPKLNIISIGKPTTIHCVISGSPINSVTWFKNGQPIKSDGITYLSRDVIRITHTDIDDVGMYQCIVKNEFESVQATTELRLGEVFPEIHKAFEETVAQPGQNVSLQCMASGSPAPQIEWSLEDRLMDSQNIQDTLNSDGDTVSTLNIPQAKVEDGGVYICSAINGLGRVQHQARLNIYGPLAVRSSSKYVLIAGKDALLNCPFYGYPVETITWVRAGETLPIDLRQQVLENGTLKLKEVQRSVDNGKYTCVVGNKDGSSAKGDVDVQIVVPVKIMPFSFQGNLLTEGMRARLQCVVAEGDPPITLKWMKDNHALSPELSIEVRSLDDFSSMLTISNVTPRHNGNYTCVAANSVSQDMHMTTLKINVPPKWTLNPKNVSVFAGQSASFHCGAEGFPSPTIKWFRAEGVSRNAQEAVHTNHEYQVFQNGTLHIPSARTQHRGFFFCKASNGVGVGLSKLVHLTVHVPPVLERRVHNLTGRAGSSFPLQCVIIGEKPINFTWKINGQNIDFGQSRHKLHNFDLQNKIISELTVLSLVKDDASNYSCTVINNFGGDECSFRLNVLEPPFHPDNLTIKEIGNGTVIAQWTEPYNGRSPITQYVIQYKEVTEGKDIKDTIHNGSISGGFTSMQITGLKPATKYEFRILAVNQLGRSEPGKTVFITMGDEAPTAPPQAVKVVALDEKTLKIFWKPPDSELWNGNTNGYYIGFKIASTSEPLEYRFLEGLENETLSYTLIDLKKYTQYSIVVHAMNNGGKGPPSKEALAMTSEGVPSKPPTDVRCSMLTSQTLHVTWQPPPTQSVNGVLRGFKVLYRPIKEFYDVPEQHYLTVALPKATLQNLLKYTNYTISVLAFTIKGDGVKSDPVFCHTLEDVPEPPADVKILAASTNSVLVSYKMPLHPNGVITKYNIYVHLTGENDNDQNKEKHTVDGNITYYEVSELKPNLPYEFWVTASTRSGESPPSKVVKHTLQGNSISARIASFSEVLRTTTSQDLKLPCHVVGVPVPIKKWIYGADLIIENEKKQILPDGSLLIKNIQRSDSGKYVCSVKNGYGEDSVTHRVIILSRPDPPVVEVSHVRSTFVEVKWRIINDGGLSLTNVELYFRKNNIWANYELDRKETKYQFQNLQCGTKYQLYAVVKNVLGSSKPSKLITVSTNGSVPELPTKAKLIEEGLTTLTVHLDAWKNGICPISNFVVQYRFRSDKDWISIGDNAKLIRQHKLVIKNLHSDSKYRVRITAHNAAGSTRAEYEVTTLRKKIDQRHSDVSNHNRIFMSFTDDRVLVPAGLSLFIVIIVLTLSCVIIQILHKLRRKKLSISVIECIDEVDPYASVGLQFTEMKLQGRSCRSKKLSTTFSKTKHSRPSLEQALRVATGSRESSVPLLPTKRQRTKNSPAHHEQDLTKEETTFVFSDSGQGPEPGTSDVSVHRPTQVQRNTFYMW